ncbi:MAG: YbaL family putative K(+) efflux transporter [Hyphomonadaceae bacterium]
MPHDAPLISLLGVGFGLAFIFGWAASRLKLSPIVGYLAAGVIVGPFTPGFVADASLASEVAEVGVILLMFGVGLHFSPKELMSVRAVAAPAALIQIVVMTALGVALGLLMGWSVGGAVVFGLAISVASTVVALRVLQDRRQVQSDKGRLTVGWLVMEDIAMIVVMVLLPTWAQLNTELDGGEMITVLQLQDVGVALAITIAKVIAFAAIMMVVGRRLVPWVLHKVVQSGSRELFRLAVLAVALGVAFLAAGLFGMSLALGALFAGLVMAESELSQEAAQETLPLSDAFAVLFFVSVGMLFDPMILIEHPVPLLATVGLIVILRTVLGYGLLRMLGQPKRASLVITASRSQIGEFSFIIAGLGVSLGLMPAEGRDYLLASSILSICCTPLVSWVADWLAERDKPVEPVLPKIPPATPAHVVLVGYGRVGSLIGGAMERAGVGLAVIETSEELAQKLNDRGIEAFVGNAASIERLREAGIEKADLLVVTVPNGFESGRIVEAARELNPDIIVYARAHSDAEVEYLQKYGANLIISGEQQIADAMISAGMEQLAGRALSPG